MKKLAINKQMSLMLLLACVAASANASSYNEVIYFQSPSKNIVCEGNAYEVSCHIIAKNSNKPARPKPKSCDFDWGHRFYVNDAGAAMDCYSDWPYKHNAPVIPYGNGISGVYWHCVSQKTGMRCSNVNGRGFHLQRAKQQLF